MVYDVIVIGGGQSGLACGYYLRRTNLNYLILDNQDSCGGAWIHGWDSLSLFSPSEYSSLPGWLMPKSKNEYPTKQEVIDYLCNYENRYGLKVERPVTVLNIEKKNNYFILESKNTEYITKAVISATGTWGEPVIPEIKGLNLFKGEQVHSAFYNNADAYIDKRVLVVGEGNSGAQILAEISRVASTYWAVSKEPQFMADDVDGRVLFDVASAKYYAEQKGETFDMKKYNLGNIVMVPSVKDARKRNVLERYGAIESFTETGIVWQNGEEQDIDVVIWCTGFKAAIGYLSDLVKPDSKGRIATSGTRSNRVEGLWLVGYGSWTGFASATLIGVGRSARSTVKEVEQYVVG